MITGAQVRAGRALIGLDQRALAALAGLSLPTIQRMEQSPDSVRVVVDSLERVLRAFAAVGVELIPDGGPSAGRGRGVRLVERLPAWVPDDRIRRDATESRAASSADERCEQTATTISSHAAQPPRPGPNNGVAS